MFVGLWWLPAVASSPNKHFAKSFAGLFAAIAHAKYNPKRHALIIFDLNH
jgi:hypothetical protein